MVDLDKTGTGVGVMRYLNNVGNQVGGKVSAERPSSVKLGVWSKARWEQTRP